MWADSHICTWEWRWYLKHLMKFRINRIWPLKERKTKSGGKKRSVTVKIQNQATTREAAHENCYILFSVHMTCRVSPETLTSLRGCKLFSRLNRPPGLWDGPRVLLQELHLRHTDPEKPEVTVPGRLLLGLTPGYFQSPLLLSSQFQRPSHREECKRWKSLKPTKEKLTK